MREEEFREARSRTLRLIEPLTPEDLTARSLPDAPSAAWRLGRTTWFVETFVLRRRSEHPGFARESDFSRPGITEILECRKRVDDAVRDCERLAVATRVEELHQELMLAAIKHLLAGNPGQPAYERAPEPASGEAPPLRFLDAPGGTLGFGRNRDDRALGSETPRCERVVRPFQIGSRLVTNGEFLEFVEDGGYGDERLWLSSGWEARRRGGWEAPLHWRRSDGFREEYTLGGRRPLLPAAPVAHLSFFEADAFARWRERRLPTEFEWESVARDADRPGASEGLDPTPAEPTPPGAPPAQLYGDAWEWTSSSFEPYPGYRRLPAADAATFGDFSPGRMVGRGGSRLTPGAGLTAATRRAIRPETRWQVTGLRLARDA